MSITFTNYSKINRLREPNFERTRAIYRGSRNSYKQNIDAGLMMEDLKRINSELSIIEEKISEKQNIFIKKSSEESFNKIEDIELYYDTGEDVELQDEGFLKIETLNDLSSKIKTIFSKVNRLERGEYND
jgi:hypothetical protein